MKILRRHPFTSVFLTVQSGIYLAFNACALFFPSNGLPAVVLKYAGVLLCFAFVAAVRKRALSYYDHSCVLLALAATATADFLMLFTPLYALAVAVFCWAHVFYLYRSRAFIARPAAMLTFAFATGGLACQAFGLSLPYVFIYSCLYALLILSAFFFTLKAALPRVNKRLAALGMGLFLLCDIHVALFNLLPHGHAYYPFATFLMWFFYLPSQVLLSLSVLGCGKAKYGRF